MKGSYFRIRLYVLIKKEEIVCRKTSVLLHVELHAYLLLVMLKESLSVSRDQDFSIYSSNVGINIVHTNEHLKPLYCEKS